MLFVNVIFGCEPEETTPIAPSVGASMATTVEPTSLTAHWKPFPLADYYLLEVSKEPEFEELIRESFPLSVKDTFQVIDNLEPETHYYYRVAAFTELGTYIDYSQAVQVVTRKLPAPKAYEAIDVNTKQFYAAWSPITDAEGYHVQLSRDIRFENVIRTFSQTNKQDTTILIDSLQSSLSYFYRVRSTKDEFVSEYSNVIYTSTAKLATPHLKVVQDIDYTTATVEWSRPDIANSYQLQVSQDPLFADDLAMAYDVEVTTNELFLPELEANTTYHARVRARQDTVFSNYSEVMVFQTLALSEPQVSVYDITTQQLAISWDPIAEADNYEIDVAIDSSFNTILTEYNAVETNTTSTIIGELSPDVFYYIRVRAYGLSSYSPYKIVKVKTLGLSAPESVIITDRRLSQFVLSWQAVISAESYLLDVATDASFVNILDQYNSKEVNSNSISISGLMAELTYYVRVRSKNGTATSLPSTAILVAASIPSTCIVSEQQWDDGWVERYTYVNSKLITIVGDSLGISSTAYRWDLSRDADGRLNLAERYENDGGGNFILSEFWEFTYNDELWTTLHRNNAASATLEFIQLGYHPDGTLSDITSFSDESTSSQNYQETYSYEGTQIVEAYNASDELVKLWKYSSDYNTEKLFSVEEHALLRKPEATTVLGFLPDYAVSVFELHSPSEVQRQTFVSETNALELPRKILSGNNQTTKRFIFESCGF